MSLNETFGHLDIMMIWQRASASAVYDGIMHVRIVLRVEDVGWLPSLKGCDE